MFGIAITVESVDVTDGAEPSRLVFSHEPLVIGRARTCEACLPDARVSSRHAEIRREGRDWFVVDLSSSNGTWLNDKRMTPHVPKLLRTGDALELGGFRLRVEVDVAVDGGTASTTALVGGELVRQVLQRMHPEAGAPRLQVVAGLDVSRGVTFDVPGMVARIGRADPCEIQLTDALASREHARVRRDTGGLVLEDLGSLNATLVNNATVRGERRLRDRDEIKIGMTRISVSDPTDGLLDSLEPLPDEAWDVRGSALVEVAKASLGASPASVEPVRVSNDLPPPAIKAAPSDTPRPSVAAHRVPWMAIIAIGAAGIAAGAAYLLYVLLGTA